MRNVFRLALPIFLFTYVGVCYPADNNLILLPAPYCTQGGVEAKINQNSTVGILARFNCLSGRPTYGSKNHNVENNFTRVLVSWKYSFNGVFSKGAFVQGLVGFEQSEFRSAVSSTTEVEFVNLGIYGGYQWFWRNGFNLSLLAGVVYLYELNSGKQINSSETTDVIDFLNKNSESNIHPGAGAIVGWIF